MGIPGACVFVCMWVCIVLVMFYSLMPSFVYVCSGLCQICYIFLTNKISPLFSPISHSFLWGSNWSATEWFVTIFIINTNLCIPSSSGTNLLRSWTTPMNTQFLLQPAILVISFILCETHRDPPIANLKHPTIRPTFFLLQETISLGYTIGKKRLLQPSFYTDFKVSIGAFASEKPFHSS